MLQYNVKEQTASHRISLMSQSQNVTHAHLQTSTALLNLLSSTLALGQTAAINTHMLSCND